MKDAILEKIKQNSISLSEFGINELAFKKEDAITLIKSLQTHEIGIFGGDVYHFIKDSLKPTYDNWFCEPQPGESKNDFFLRSKTESLKYIQNYKINSNQETLFVIVFTDQN